jgi:ABC-type glycerol-3-phosphate transport system substrate-binding protein
MPRKILVFSIGLLILLTGVTWIPLFAQNDEIIVTVGIEEWQQDVFNDELFALFQAEHPGIKIVPVILAQDNRFYGRPYDTEQDVVDEYLEQVQGFVSSADILPVTSYGFDLHATRAGGFLDLTPLVAADANAALDDFYAPMLESFQWDGGLWALPLSGTVQVIVYNKTKFDEVGVPYPDETWTINDYIEAGRELAEYNDSGEVEMPGFFGFDNRLLYRAFLGHNLLDETTFPPQPAFDDPQLAALMEAWTAYEQEIMPDDENGFNFNFDEVPLTISGLWRLSNNFGPNSGDEFEAALLPGGTAGLDVQGFAISAGTPNPQAAYTVLQWLTHSPDAVNRMFGDRPARRSLIGAEGQLESNFFRQEYSEDVEALMEEAMEGAIPVSDLIFFDYLYNTANIMEEEGVDLATALQDVEQEALDILGMVENSSQNTVVTVATPVPTPVLSAGEISLKFGIQSFIMPMPNRDAWLAAIDEFTVQDAEVKQVELLTDFMGLEEQAESQDCFFLYSNVVQTGDVSLLLPVDPFLAADPTFDPNDVIPGAMQQMTSGGNVYGVPMTIQPYVIWYNSTMFEDAGVAEPFNGWTVSDFETTLRDYFNATGDSAYLSQSFGSTYIMQMIAAYGGQPIDYSTEPYTYTLTDPAFIQAAEQVLGLAQEGLLDYQALASFGGGGGGGEVAMYDSVMRTDDWRFQNRAAGDSESEYIDPYRIVTFPVGTEFKPIAYDLGGVYISSQTQHPEACYRWISFLNERPELMSSMPARRSLIEAAAASVPNGDDVLAVYQELDTLLQDPNVLILPGQFGSGSSANPAVGYINFVSSLWMNMGFDAYVLEEAELLSEMETAEQYIEEFQTCTASIPDPAEPIQDMEQEAITAYFEQFEQCAITVDPQMSEFFGDE